MNFEVFSSLINFKSQFDTDEWTFVNIGHISWFSGTKRSLLITKNDKNITKINTIDLSCATMYITATCLRSTEAFLKLNKQPHQPELLLLTPAHIYTLISQTSALRAPPSGYCCHSLRLTRWGLLLCAGGSFVVVGGLWLCVFPTVPFVTFWKPQPFGLGILVGPGRRNASRGIWGKPEQILVFLHPLVGQKKPKKQQWFW